MATTKVLTEASTLQCGHGGSLSTTASTSKITVDAKKALVKADVQGATISGCGNTQDPPHGLFKCTAVSLVSAGEATELSVGGTFVMLDTVAGVTNGTPAGTITVIDAGQTKLTAA